MTISSVSQWSATIAADNNDLNDIPLDENLMKGPHVNDAFQELMKQAKAGFALNASPALTGTPTVTSTDAGAAAGPSVVLYRNSASPADLDIIGEVVLRGKNGSAADADYVKLQGVINKSAANESGGYQFVRRGSGTEAAVYVYSSTAAYGHTFTGGLSSSGSLQVGGGAAIAVLDSGTYTPTATLSTNMAAATPTVAIWLRVGNMVMVAGAITLDVTTTGISSEVDLSLPVASDFASSADLAGSGSAQTIAVEAQAIFANVASNRATMQYLANTAASHVARFTFMYQVI